MVVFDLQALQSESFGERGIGRYVFDLASTLAAEQSGSVDAFAWNDRLPRSRRLDELTSSPQIGDRLRSFSELRGERVDVLHVNAPFEMADYADIVVPVRADRLVVTCYDLIPLRFDDVYLSDPVIRARYLTRLALLNAADAVVTDSRSAADDVVELAGVARRRTTVIGAGVGPQFRLPVTPLEERLDQLRRYVPDVRASFVLVPTGIDWRKNIDGAIAAFSRLPEPVRRQRQLVLACELDDDQRLWIQQLARDAGVSDRLVVTGHVPDAGLVLLYQCAELVLFPSFYEGFGLPVLEARRCGARVICSNSSSLPEVLPDTRALFDPWDTDDISGRLLAALTDPGLMAALDAAPDPPFSWSSTARRLTEVYESVAQVRDVDTPGTSRLGVITVLPPTSSGVADHSERLLDAIDAEIDGVDIVAYVAGGSDVERPYPVLPLAALADDWAAGELDGVVYCVGNNRLHRDVLTLAPLVPGHVFLHDVMVPALSESPSEHPEHPEHLTERAIDAAVGVLVQSAHAVELAQTVHGVAAVDIGPHPCQVVDDASSIDDGGHLPWVISAGIAHEAKRSDVVASAMAELVEGGHARAALVGPGGGRFVGADDDIVVTGEVDDEEFDEWLRRSSVLLQLRRSSNGESSGVVAHAMARGVPLVISDIGAMAEVPDDVAVHVPVDIEPADLAATVLALLNDEDRLASMRRAGVRFAARETPAAQARRLVSAVFGTV